MGPSSTNWLFLLYINMVSLYSGSDLLNHTAKDFSLNPFWISAWHRQSTGNFCWLHSFYNSFLGLYEHHTWILMLGRVPKFTTNNPTLPLLRASIDDLSLMTTKVSGAQTLPSWCITCFDLGWPRVQSWEILLYCHC